MLSPPLKSVNLDRPGASEPSGAAGKLPGQLRDAADGAAVPRAYTLLGEDAAVLRVVGKEPELERQVGCAEGSGVAELLGAGGVPVVAGEEGGEGGAAVREPEHKEPQVLPLTRRAADFRAGGRVGRGAKDGHPDHQEAGRAKRRVQSGGARHPLLHAQR